MKPIAKCLLGFLLVFGWAVAPAWGQTAGEERSINRLVQLSLRDGRIGLSLEHPEIFTERLKQRLLSGFTSRIVVGVQVFRLPEHKPWAQGLMELTILYDIWEERFLVRDSGPGFRRREQVASMEEVLARYGRIQNLFLIKADDEPEPARVLVEVRIEVNPTSVEGKKKVREYLANPDGRNRLGSGQSFFGSFSSIFVNEKNFKADAVFTFRSPEMVWPPPTVNEDKGR